MAGITDYLASKIKELTPDKWDGLLRALDSRFRVLEEQLGIERRVTESILQRGLQVIEDGIGPFILQAQDAAANIASMADLGALFSATSTTTMEINANEKSLIIPEGQRAQFAPAAFVLVSAGDNFANSFVGRRISYNRLTGVLVLAVEYSQGAGVYSEWRIGPVATTSDLEALRDQVQADRQATAGDRAAAQAARTDAQTARTGSINARSGAEAALGAMQQIIAPPGAVAPATATLGRLWYDTGTNGGMTRVWDGTSWAPAVTASIGGLRFEEGAFGENPTGEITVGGGFSYVMVWLNGKLLTNGVHYAAVSPVVTISGAAEGDEYFVWAYRALDATDYYTKEEAGALLGTRLRFDTAQGLNNAQKAQALGNLGVSPLIRDLLDDTSQTQALTTLGVGEGLRVLRNYATAAEVFAAMKVGATTDATGVVRKATAAELAAGTPDRYPDAALLAPALVAAGPAAMVSFEGGNPPAIRSQRNIASVVRLGAGNYRINFATQMASADYVVSTTLSNPGAGQVSAAGITEQTDKALTIQCIATNSAVQGAVNPSIVCVTIFNP